MHFVQKLRLLFSCLVSFTFAESAPTPPTTSELYKIIENLSKRVEVLEARELAAQERSLCDKKFPILQSAITYGGCNRNMIKNTTRSVETCQTGDFSMYNTSSTPTTGLFDAKIHVHNDVGDIYHFLCTYTNDEPHIATCTLTYEEPARLQGPALITIRFRDVTLAPSSSSLPAGTCVAGSATIIGNYFYDSQMVAAGVYSFYAEGPPPDAHNPSLGDSNIV